MGADFSFASDGVALATTGAAGDGIAAGGVDAATGFTMVASGGVDAGDALAAADAAVVRGAGGTVAGGGVLLAVDVAVAAVGGGAETTAAGAEPGGRP